MQTQLPAGPRAHAPDSIFTRIAARGSTFQDRLGACIAVDDASAAGGLPGPGLLEWSRVLSADAETLEKRFGWDELNSRIAGNALDPRLLEEQDAPLPEWMLLLGGAYGSGPEALRATFGDDELLSDPLLAQLGRVPFGFLYLPLIRDARRRLQARAGEAYDLLNPEAHRILEGSLTQRLVQICERALYAEFSVFRNQQVGALLFTGGENPVYWSFVREMVGGRFWSFFHQYSVAARLCGRVTELWIDAVAEFLQRLEDDMGELERWNGEGPLGKVASLSANLSDPHGGGRSVIIPEFESGFKVVYKPRPLGLDRFFSELVEWVNAAGGALPLKVVGILCREEYGWIEFVEHRACANEEEVADFYTRCGMLLCLAYALNGSDFHFENLIASGAHPVLIDMEALLGHRFRLGHLTQRNAGSSEASTKHFENSVLKVGMLPLLRLQQRGCAMDIGGIAGLLELDEPVRASYWSHVNSDRMKLAYREVTQRTAGSNRAMLGDQETDVNAYAGCIAEGFRQTYRLVLANREALLGAGGLLERLKGHPVRFIFRATSLYGTLLHRTLHPKYLRNGADRSIQLDALTKPLLAFDEPPHVWPILRAERDAMEQMDIPLFDAISDSTALVLPGGRTIQDCFACSAFDEVTNRFGKLSEEDMVRQAELIVGSLAANTNRSCRASTSVARTANTTPEGSFTREAALGAAQEIAAILRSRKVSLEQDGVAWFTAQYLPHFRRYRLDVSGRSLFDGSAGIALFLAALNRARPGHAYDELARAALGPVAGDVDSVKKHLAGRTEVDLGAGTGIGSTVYALTRSALLLEAPELLDAASSFAALLDEETLAKDCSYDVASGSAGAILGLLVLHEATGDERVLTAARHAGHHLLGARVVDPETGYRIWHTWMGRAETGFAHGIAGIAYALHRLHRRAGGDALLLAAQEAVAYEQTRLGPDLEGTAEENATAAWSYGAAGVGLARLGEGEGVDRSTAEREVEASLNIAERYIQQGPDSLCCGRMGWADLWLTAGVRLRRPELVTRARGVASLVVAGGTVPSAYETGWPSGHQELGLFHGLAGVGYQLIRLTDPERFPSLLLLE